VVRASHCQVPTQTSQLGCPSKLVSIRNKPKLEPKLVSALSETKCLFRFYIETENFGVSTEPKQTEDQPKQFDREHILVFFHKILCCFELFRFVSVCFETVCFSCFEFYTEIVSFDVSIEPKKTEDQPKQFDRGHILVFFRKFRVVSFCFGLIRNSSVCFGCFDIGLKQRNKPKQTENFSFWFHEINRNTSETDLFSVCFGSNRNIFFVSRTP
jgi:hypothetical protein